METGDEVTTTLGGRLVRGTVLYVRDGSVRIDVPGRKPITRPIARVVKKTPLPVSLAPLGGRFTPGALFEPDMLSEPGPPALRPVPKPPKPLRDAAYMKWVRDEHACCIRGCGAPATEAHHHGPRGMGQKTDDYRVLPMCARCHREFHDTGTVDGMPRDEFDAFAARWQAGLLFDYLRISESEGCALDGLIEAIRRSNDG